MAENRKGGYPTRVGEKFHEEINGIMIGRIKNGKSKEKISSEKITDLIARHKDFAKIKEEILNIDDKELEKIWN